MLHLSKIEKRDVFEKINRHKIIKPVSKILNWFKKI